MHPAILFDSRDPAQLEKVHAAGREILTRCVELGGTLTGEHGIGMEKNELMPVLFTDDDLEVMAHVRNAFNPAWPLQSAEDPAHSAQLPRRCHVAPASSRGEILNATASPSLRVELARIAGDAHVWDTPGDLHRIAINHVVPSVMVAPGQ